MDLFASTVIGRETVDRKWYIHVVVHAMPVNSFHAGANTVHVTLANAWQKYLSDPAEAALRNNNIR